jgi:cell filamentation protein
LKAPVDPYCIPGTKVLRNLPGISDPEELEIAESLAASLAGVALYNSVPLRTDLKYLKSIHRTLFGKIYSWAGETRLDLGRMTKVREDGSAVVYGDSTFVASQLDLLFTQLQSERYLNGLAPEAFAARAAHFYGELDAIHPFREGNSRTLRLFFYGVAQRAGYRLSWDAHSGTPDARRSLYRARDLAVMRADSSALAAIFSAILSPL